MIAYADTKITCKSPTWIIVLSTVFDIIEGGGGITKLELKYQSTQLATEFIESF